MIEQRPTSIRLFLADGTADGLWRVEKSNWTGVGLMAPRSRYSSLRVRPELAGPGLYVLLGPPDSGSKSVRIYIGETDILKERLDSHQRSKDFWTRVIVFTSKDANLNKAHVRYLESRLIRIATEANRAEIENSSTSAVPSLSEADTADMEAFLDDMLLIYPVLGLNAFEPTVSAEEASVAPRLYLTGKDTKAEGRETAEGFVVYAGSLARAETVPSVHAYGLSLRSSLLTDGVLMTDGDHLRLTQDFVFTSPSTAAMVMLGRTSNGRVEWRDADGVTLKDLQEREVSGPPS